MFKKTVSRNIQLIGLGFFLFYGALSVIFFKERMLSFDSAAYALEVLQTKSFYTPLGRWSSILSQALPLFFLEIGCSLVTFLKIYSVSFILLSYIGFLFISLFLKDKRASIVYLFVFCLVTRHTFYFAIAELFLGVLLTVVLYALVKYSLIKDNKKSLLAFCFSFILIFVLYYFHQLMIIGVLFVLLVIYFNNRIFQNVKLIALIVFTLVRFGVNILLISGDSYEGKKIPGIETFIQQLPQFFELESYQYFIHHVSNELMVPLLIVIGSIFYLIYKKKYLLSALFVSFPLGYLILIVITYYKGESPNMYELYYVLFGLFFSVTTGFTFLIKVNNKTISLFVIPLLIYSSIEVYNAHFLPTMRINFLELLVTKGKKVENKKYIIHPDDFPWGYGWVTWAVPAETLLLSSLKNKSDGVVFYVPSINEEVDTSSNNGQLLGPAWQQYFFNATVLDTNYFSIPLETNYLITNRVKRSESYIKSKIRFDLKWREDVKGKANERGVTLEEMITIDARYVLDHSAEEVLLPVRIKE